MTDATKTVLLVEDNEDNRTVYRTILEHFGYQVIEARNGEDGVRMAREDHPDLILMDISIPLIDGWEATRILKGEPEHGRDPDHRADRARPRHRPRQGGGGRVRRLPRQALRAAPGGGRGGALHRGGAGGERLRDAASGDRGPARILVVDDVPDNVEILDARLTSRGYRVETATNGEEALDKVRESRRT
jgi:CheY-like chemotaxis protein